MEQFRIYLINLYIFQMYAKYENQYLFALFIKNNIEKLFYFFTLILPYLVISYVGK